MKVQIHSDWSVLPFQLVYRQAEHSFATVPKPDGGITSVLINDLQLEIDDEGTVLYVWGLFPRADKCDTTTASPPKSVRKTLRFASSEEWTPGVSVRLNKRSWDYFVNESTGWVAVGNPNTPPISRAIEFAPNSIAVLDGDSVVAVWLKPANEAANL